jgi:hypothetical protein
VQYIRIIDEIGLGVRIDQISNLANSILKKDYTGEDSPSTIGQH